MRLKSPLPSFEGGGPARAGSMYSRKKDLERRARRRDHPGRDDIGAGGRRGPLSLLLLVGWLLVSFPALDREHPADEHGEEHVHPNEAAFRIGATFEAQSRDNLSTVGGGYVFELGERYSIAAGDAYDWIDEEHTTETAIVYGVKLGIAFQENVTLSVRATRGVRNDGTHG